MFPFRKSSSLSVGADFLGKRDGDSSRRQTWVLALVFALIVGSLSALGASVSYRATNDGTSILYEVGRLPVINGLRQLAGGSATTTSATITKDRLNILLLGIGGEGHDGAELTDTILLASIDTKTNRVALLSIPRDLAYPLGGGRFEKINALNADYEKNFPGEGATRTAQAFSLLLDIPIDHVVRLDFNGFNSFIDALGGIDVTVERTFSDNLYPTFNDKWMTISFKKGPQHMDGKTALIFARSRHGNNGEGSDFARSRRQQLVILAVREKLLSLGTISNPQKLAALYAAIVDHLQTDMTPWDGIKLAPLMKDFSPDRITMRVLDDAPGHELVAANVNGAFMLFPRKPDWMEIREIAKDPFTPRLNSLASPSATTLPTATAPHLEVKNGTLHTGFAAQIAAQLERQGFDVKSFGNAVRRNYEQTTVFDLTGGKKPTELAKILRLLRATVSLSSPQKTAEQDGLPPEKASSNDIDFLVILGEASMPLLNQNDYANP